jgi:23S rRNA pseudouridine1911/1915/1917 synthase
MIAKNDKAHQSLAKQLAEHTITRSYRAIVYNNFNHDEGIIDRPLGRDPKNRLKQAVTEFNSRRAVTHYRVLERFGDFTYIEVRLETGRTHQIRVHMAYVKHPLLGDQVYGPQKKYFGVGTQMLHAQKIGFVHPSTGKYMEFESDLPEEFSKVLHKLKEGK